MTTSDSEILNSHFARIKNDYHAQRMAYGVSVDGQTVAAEEPSLPFRIASMSKSFTAAAVLLLRDLGRLQLDLAASDYVPELRSLQPPTSDSPPVTLRHLLTMSSGLATDDPWADRHLDADMQFMRELFSSGGHFAIPPGTGYVYSNYGYAILGQIVSNIAEVPFQQFITTELLEPLEMSSTTWDPPTHRANPHRLEDDEVIDEGSPPLGDGGFAAMGGLWSNVHDLLAWTNFLMDGFPPRDERDDGPLRRSSRREMQQVHSFRAGDNVKLVAERRPLHGGYGMGLVAYHDEITGPLVTHTGGLPGYGSNMTWYPDRKLAVVSMANVTYADMFRANIEAVDVLRVNGRLPGARSSPMQQLQEQASALIALLNDWDDDVANTIFSDNVALDESYERRRRHVATLTGGSGIAIEGFIPTNAAEGEILASINATKASVTIKFSLSSQQPPLIQAYSIKKAL